MLVLCRRLLWLDIIWIGRYLCILQSYKCNLCYVYYQFGQNEKILNQDQRYDHIHKLILCVACCSAAMGSCAAAVKADP